MPRLPLSTLIRQSLVSNPKYGLNEIKEYFEYAGAAGGYIDKYGYPFCRGRILHIVEKDEGQYDTPADILWATGACLFVRTATYKEVGGIGCRILRTSRRGRYVLAFTFPGISVGMRPAIHRLPRWWSHLERGKSPQDFLEFPKQLINALQEFPEEDLKHVMCVRFWLTISPPQSS